MKRGAFDLSWLALGRGTLAENVRVQGWCKTRAGSNLFVPPRGWHTHGLDLCQSTAARKSDPAQPEARGATRIKLHSLGRRRDKTQTVCSCYCHAGSSVLR